MLKLFRPSSLKTLTIDFSMEPTASPYELEQFLQTYGWNLEHIAVTMPASGFMAKHSSKSSDLALL